MKRNEKLLFPDLNAFAAVHEKRSTADLLKLLTALRAMHSRGELGGTTMPEDSHPGLQPDSFDNFHYFTLTMVLNYQRNSFTLWRSATATYNEPECRFVFNPGIVASSDTQVVREALLRHRLALQPTRHVANWMAVCRALSDIYCGDVRHLFRETGGDVRRILDEVQVRHKKRFPYLSGMKICNYWLSVMERYTSARLTGRDALSVAPDTHVVQASLRLGLLESRQSLGPNVQTAVATAWDALLKGTGIAPIDIHEALWLWSRAGFPWIRS